jgi:hypothetical protein
MGHPQRGRRHDGRSGMRPATVVGFDFDGQASTAAKGLLPR